MSKKKATGTDWTQAYYEAVNERDVLKRKLDDLVIRVKDIVKELDGYMHNQESYDAWLELKELCK